ncbi:MAG TPA: hypothetical protein VGF59_08980 [Bryobacteraceae bacterium]
MRCAVIALFVPLLATAAEIPQGSHVLLRLVNSIDTRTAQEGEYVYFRTAVPIFSNGQIVVPADSYVQGIVSRAKRSGRVTGRAELSFRIDTLTLPNGKSVKLSSRLASVDSEGTEQKVESKEGGIQQGGTKGHDAAQVAKISGVGAAIGGHTDSSWSGAGIGGGIGAGAGLATVLLTRGREVTLRAGSTVDVVFDRAVVIE